LQIHVILEGDTHLHFTGALNFLDGKLHARASLSLLAKRNKGGMETESQHHIPLDRWGFTKLQISNNQKG
jgi:hypothetical protein